MIRNSGVVTRWGIQWRSKNKLEGVTEHLLWDCGPTPLLFRTRHEAREFRNHRWGYFRTRKDLQREPHGWKLPRVVKVHIAWRIDE